MITCKRKLKEFNMIHLKFVDDFTVAEAIDINSQLTMVPVNARPQPDNFHDRTGHILEPRILKFLTNL